MVGDAAGQHGLAGAGRSAEEQVVAAGSRDLECLPPEGNAADVGEVDELVVEAGGGIGGVGRHRVPVGPGLLALQTGPQLGERAGGPHPDVADERGLGRVGERDHDAFGPGAGERVDQRERAGDRPNRAVEAELAEHRDAVEHPGGERVVGAEHAHRHGELEAGAGLAHASRREVHRDPALRPLEARRQDRGADTLA